MHRHIHTAVTACGTHSKFSRVLVLRSYTCAALFFAALFFFFFAILPLLVTPRAIVKLFFFGAQRSLNGIDFLEELRIFL